MGIYKGTPVEAGIFKEAHRKYYVDFETTDYMNKKVRKRKKGFTSLASAVEFRDNWVSSVKLNPSDGKLTIESLASKYLSIKKLEWSQTTYTGYKGIVDLHIIPYVGNWKVEQVTALHVKEYQQMILNDGKSKNTANKARSLLSSIYGFGMEFLGLTFNPFAVVKNIKVPDTEKVQPIFLENDDVDKFLSVISDVEDYALFVTLFDGGLRRGEVQALRIDHDVFLEEGYLLIQHSMTQKISGLPYELRPTKGNRKRKVYMTKRMIDSITTLIEAHRDSYLYKPGAKADFFLFGGPKHYPNTTLAKRATKYSKLAGIPRFRIHDTRHSHASNILDMNVSSIKVAQRLGHSNPSITEKVYSHASKNAQIEIVNMLNKKNNPEN